MSEQQTFTWQQESFFLMTVDPVHIGTGGMRLGRVDNTIVREPGTRLPKIPGTSLAGACRQYAAALFNKRSCAGQVGHCGRPTCPICYTFGFTKGEEADQSQQGTVALGDARILFFPVHSTSGPLWTTTAGLLQEAGLMKSNCPSPSDDTKVIWPEAPNNQSDVNLNWLMFQREDQNRDLLPADPIIPPAIRKRIVLLTDRVFSHVVNSGLEVRTSVSINPETGAAQQGALFTYEAIPRATILWTEIVMDDFRQHFPSRKKLEEYQKKMIERPNEKKRLLEEMGIPEPGEKLDQTAALVLDWINEDLGRYLTMEEAGKQKAVATLWNETPMDVVRAGLHLAETLGIGGMGTRGFGRIRLLSRDQVDKNKGEHHART